MLLEFKFQRFCRGAAGDCEYSHAIACGSVIDQTTYNVAIPQPVHLPDQNSYYNEFLTTLVKVWSHIENYYFFQTIFYESLILK